jgi:hypothetical protein
MDQLLLPYENYTWSMSHHVRKITENMELAFYLLNGAQLFRDKSDFADKITKYIIDLNLIPANVREDRAQIWRDYQQVLPELGLIVSTRYTKRQIIVTALGKMWLSGMIGSRELLTTQALRYQYPNGQKLVLPPAARKEFDNDPPNRIELDMRNGVLIKPAVLILRILLELLEMGIEPKITNRECAECLMPIKTNRDWALGLAALLQNKKLERVNRLPVPRFIQEWFALLGATDLFIEEKSQGKRGDASLRLSDFVIANENYVKQLCEFHEREDNFWIPLGTDKNTVGESWFAYYGMPTIENQWVLPQRELTSEYIDENYIEGFQLAENSEEVDFDYQEWSETIKLRPFEQNKPSNYGSTAKISEDAINNFVHGYAKRQAKTFLHDQIVEIIAKRLTDVGFNVHEDRKSVDLLVYKNAHESILEVKTVTPRNLKHQFRYGVGQLAEYRYKREIQCGRRPSSVLVLSSSPQFSWIPTFLKDDIKIGLVSLVAGDKFIAHTSGEIEQILSI